MRLIAVMLFAGASQVPASPVAFAPNCAAPTDAATGAACAGDERLRNATAGDADDDERDAAWRQAAASFRRAADLARDPALKRYVLNQLEIAYDDKHLDQPRDAEPVLRELIAISPGDLAPVFQLARVQERQEQFDAAESTLLAAQQLKPDDVEPYRELAQYFARRASALSAEAARQERRNHPEETDQPDKDGVYRLGNGV
jgi:tetratricopeptide (TPR) repeat protein